jgi:hypothetical protein
VGEGFDRVLEVRRSNCNFDKALAFALINIGVSGGLLTQDPFDFENAITGGGIKVYGGHSLFYNVVVQGNAVDLVDGDSFGGGIAITFPLQDYARPYAYSAVFERFSVVDNTSADYYGGVFANNPPSAIKTDGIVMRNGTVAGNHAPRAGGIWASNSSLSFLSVVDNTSEFESAGPTSGYSAGFTGSDNILRNMLMAGNFSGVASSDCRVFDPSFGQSNISLGYNLIQSSDPACVISGDTTGNLIDIDPQLGARELLSGGMPIYRLMAGSPAANVIPQIACSDGRGFAVTTDVRGVSRRGSGDAFCDIGAVENEQPMFKNSFE